MQGQPLQQYQMDDLGQMVTKLMFASVFRQAWETINARPTIAASVAAYGI